MKNLFLVIIFFASLQSRADVELLKDIVIHPPSSADQVGYRDYSTNGSLLISGPSLTQNYVASKGLIFKLNETESISCFRDYDHRTGRTEHICDSALTAINRELNLTMEITCRRRSPSRTLLCTLGDYSNFDGTIKVVF